MLMLTDEALRVRLVHEGFTPGKTTFHGGQQANHKLNLDHTTISQAGLLDEVADRFEMMVDEWQPDFLVGVPGGATGYAIYTALKLGRHCSSVALRKTNNGYAFQTSFLDEINAERGERGVIVEDVANRRGSILDVYRLRKLTDKIVGAVCVWDRSIENDDEVCQLPEGVELKSIIKQGIPPEIATAEEILNYGR
jgi:orotate phosphoribosyltransferase